MSTLFHPYLCRYIVADWLIKMFKQSRFNSSVIIGGKIIVYNSMTKAFLHIKNEYAIEQVVCDINSGDCEAYAHKSLIDNGFIVEAEKDELAELKYIFNKGYFNDDTLSIALMPSMACNFACPYCFEEPYRDSKINPAYFPTLKKYAEKNFRYYNHVDVNMFGGEPLLFFEEMQNYLEYVAELSQKYCFAYSCSIITNGSLLTNHIMEALKLHKCNSMQITIDGCKRTHDQTRNFRDGRPSFDHLLSIINNVVGPYLHEMGMNFTLRFNLLNNSIEEVKDSLLLVEPQYRDKISVFFRNVYDTSCFEGNNSNSVNDYSDLLAFAEAQGFKIMYNQYFARSCEACSDANFGYITSDLAFWKCLNAKDCKENFGKIGQILEDGTIRFDAARLVEWYTAANCFDNEKCLQCSQLPDCLGGCIAHSVANQGKCRVCSEFNLTSLPFLYI